MYEIIYKVTVSRFLHSPKLVFFYFLRRTLLRCFCLCLRESNLLLSQLFTFSSAGWARRAHGTSYLRCTPITAWRPMWSQNCCHSQFTASASWLSIGWVWVCRQRSRTTFAPSAKVSDAALISCSLSRLSVRTSKAINAILCLNCSKPPFPLLLMLLMKHSFLNSSRWQANYDRRWVVHSNCR